MRQAQLRDRVEELEAALETVSHELASLREDIEEVLGPEESEKESGEK